MSRFFSLSGGEGADGSIRRAGISCLERWIARDWMGLWGRVEFSPYGTGGLWYVRALGEDFGGRTRSSSRRRWRWSSRSLFRCSFEDVFIERTVALLASRQPRLVLHLASHLAERKNLLPLSSQVPPSPLPRRPTSSSKQKEEEQSVRPSRPSTFRLVPPRARGGGR